MRARVHVTLKEGVLDPQGEAMGKVIELDLAEADRDAARSRVRDMCEKLLANTVIEDYRVEVE